MSENIVITHFLDKIPQLIPFYNHERQILKDNEMTEYLFFAYVVEPIFKLSVSDNDQELLERIFIEIEWYALIFPNDCVDIICSTLFENFEDVFLSGEMAVYMKLETAKIWKNYCKTI